MRWSALRFPALAVPVVAGALTIGASSAALALEPKTWEYGGGGQWPLVEAPAAAAEKVPNPTLDRAEQLLADGSPGAAEDVLVDWVTANRTAPDRDRGLFLLAGAYHRQGDRLKAFYQYDELLDTYPESAFFYPSLEQQYVIGDDLLKGAKRKVLGVPLLAATDEGIDMLYRVQERSPGSALAERAMLRTADFYYNTGQFDLASDVYAAYLRSYPRSPDVPRVRLRRAFSAYAQFRGVRYDATPLLEARAQLEDIKAKYPEMAAEVNVQRFIGDINASLAQKLLYTADFYRRTGYDAAAAVSYRQCIDAYPDTREAETARAALAALPESAKAEPMPSSAKPFEAPATQPTEAPPAVTPLGPTTNPAVVPIR